MRTEPNSAAGRPAWSSWALLAVGVFSVAVSAILIRYARGAEPLAVAFWRCALGAVALAPFAAPTVARMRRADTLLPVVAGAFLAVHFASWITSLEKTSVANSVLLVSTTPVFTALAARYLGRELLGRRVWWGIVVALAGTAAIALAGPSTGAASRLGDALALAGAVTVAGYTLAGEASRRTLGIAPYAALTYGTAALVLLPAALALGVPLWGYDAQTWVAIAAIVVGPQLLGHTVLNLVLKDLGATTVAVAVMAEPPIAIAFAYALFAEVPSAWIYPGGAAIIAGILLVTIPRGRAPELVD